jgi:hypothetical protein
MRNVRNKINQNDQVKEDEMGRACSTHGKRNENSKAGSKEITRRPTCRWEDNIKLPDLYVGGRIILK